MSPPNVAPDTAPTTAADPLGSSPALPRLARIEAWALRTPIATPVVTSFGTMRDRPAVFVRLTDADGAQGWGEVWCNFPGVGAEHRARLLIDTVAPLALKATQPGAAGGALADVPALWQRLDAELRVLAIQTGEPGPLAQCVSAIDQAAWDLVARRAGLPLWRLLGHGLPGATPGEVAQRAAQATGRARVYASGLHPSEAVELAEGAQARGHTAFKMKVGFEPALEQARLADLRAAVGEGATLMLDANQGWTAQQTPARVQALLAQRPIWIEEPIRADQAPADWAALAQAVPLPLAAGENLRGLAEFDAHLAAQALRYVQPDLGKWGGFSGCRAVALRAEAAGATFCPHWLGGPLGLLGSMHLRVALGDKGYVEWDANPNPTHAPLADQLPAVHGGAIALGEAPGLGVAVDIAAWAGAVSWQGVARA